MAGSFSVGRESRMLDDSHLNSMMIQFTLLDARAKTGEIQGIEPRNTAAVVIWFRLPLNVGRSSSFWIDAMRMAVVLWNTRCSWE